MSEIRNWAALDLLLIKIVEECLKDVGKKVNELLREHVDTDVYKAGNRTNYYARGTMQPTFELRESVTTSGVKTEGKSSVVHVYHDPQKMTFSPDEFIHGSRYWKDGVTDIRALLPMIIDKGLSGDLFTEGWWTQERPYFRNTINELKMSGLLAKYFKEALKNHGINVE